MKLLTEGLRLTVIVRIQDGDEFRIASAEIMQLTVDIEHDFSELRRPPDWFVRSRHETRVMVNGLEQSGLELSASIENTEVAPAEAARAINADMDEGGHQPACPWPSDTALRRHQIEIADALHEARIGLLFRREQERPVGGIGNVLE